VTAFRPLYRWASLALPGDLRRKHAPSMEALLLRQLADARAHGRLRSWAVGWRAIMDAVVRGLYERRTARRGRHDHTSGWEVGMDGLRQDLGFAVRSLVRAPRFSAVAIVTLALGIGASTAVFSVLDGVVLRPLPFPEPNRFVHLAWDHGRGPTSALTALQLQYWTENTRSFEAVATYRSFVARVEEGDRPVGLPGLRVSAGFFAATGWSPSLGRGFTAREDVPGGPPVALVSDALWRARFAASPAVVGQALRLGDATYTVIGVLPPEFEFPQVSRAPEIVVPWA